MMRMHWPLVGKDIRWPLVAYLGFGALSMILLAFATQPVVKHYIDRRIEQNIVQRLRADKICRHVSHAEMRNNPMAAVQSIEACRDLIDRVASAATAKQ